MKVPKMSLEQSQSIPEPSAMTPPFYRWTQDSHSQSFPCSWELSLGIWGDQRVHSFLPSVSPPEHEGTRVTITGMTLTCTLSTLVDGERDNADSDSVGLGAEHLPLYRACLQDPLPFLRPLQDLLGCTR